MSLLINFNGTIDKTAQVSVLDRGFLYGDSIYEVVRTFQGRTFGLKEHLDRLRQSAHLLYMQIPWSDQHIQTEVERTLIQANWSESYIRIVVTRGTETRITLQPSPEVQSNLIIIISEISPQPELSKTGQYLVIPQRIRNSKQALDPAAKTGNYLNNILALLEAQQQGADDALLLNAAGEITEATTSNLWIVHQGIVYTPPFAVGILHGITRQFLLQILQEQQIPHQEKILYAEDLWQAEEACLSSSVRLLMPIRQINDYVLPTCPGAITTLMWEQLLTKMAAHHDFRLI